MSTTWETNSGPVLLARLRRRVEELEEEVERRRRSGEELGRRRSEVDRLSKLVWGQVQGRGVRCKWVECSIVNFSQVRYSAARCSAGCQVRCSGMRCTAVRCSTVLWKVRHSEVETDDRNRQLMWNQM